MADALRKVIADYVFQAAADLNAISVGDEIAWLRVEHIDDHQLRLVVNRGAGRAPIKYYAIKVTEVRL